MSEPRPRALSVSRRRLLGAVAGGAASALAGCSGGDTADAASGAALADSSSVIGHEFRYLPGQAQLNPWAANYPIGFHSLLFEPLMVETVGGDRRLAGPAESLSVEGTEVTVTYGDEYTWWSGKPVTARDQWTAHRINDLIGATGDRPRAELRDEHTIRYSFETPLRRRLAMERVVGETLNTASWVFGQWIDRLESATTTDERESIVERLRNWTLSLEEAADRGFGCGPYELTEVSPNRLLLDRHDDHPDAESITVPRAWFPVARQRSATEMILKGSLDFGFRLLAHDGLAEDAPPYIEQLDEHLVEGGTKLVLNWQNKHLGRRNVRRAILSVLPLDLIAENAEWGVPAEVQTGLFPPANRKWLDASVREALYRYPVEGDVEAASEFMRAAGYRRDGDRWQGPDGDTAQLWLRTPLRDGWTAAAETMAAAFEEFGIRTDLQTVQRTSFIAEIGHENYDAVPWWTNGTPFEAYDVADRSLGSIGYGVTDPEEPTTERAKPTRPTIPADSGSLEVEDGAVTLDLAALWQELRRTNDPERTREIVSLFARWWNYDLPDLYLATGRMGVWGNTRDFEWPDPDEDIYRTAGPSNRVDYHLLRMGRVRPAE